MRKPPDIATSRMVEIYDEMLSCRRMYCADDEFFLMPDVWEYLCEEDPSWSIKLYRSRETESFKCKAGIVVLGNMLRLTADEQLFVQARAGCNLMNFILAHELGHVALGHHDRNAVTKNFQLSSRRKDMAIIPPTQEELEANFAAIFFSAALL